MINRRWPVKALASHDTTWYFQYSLHFSQRARFVFTSKHVFWTSVNMVDLTGGMHNRGTGQLFCYMSTLKFQDSIWAFFKENRLFHQLEQLHWTVNRWSLKGCHWHSWSEITHGRTGTYTPRLYSVELGLFSCSLRAGNSSWFEQPLCRALSTLCFHKHSLAFQ